MKIKVVNAGNCVICGRKIEMAKDKHDELPNIFFCPECDEKRRAKKGKPLAESEDEE